jgi:hypothetical protein
MRERPLPGGGACRPSVCHGGRRTAIGGRRRPGLAWQLEEHGMARKVNEFPASPSRTAYPWDEWLDGHIWELVPGKDFKGSSDTFRSNATLQAKRRDGKIRSRRLGEPGSEGERLYIQFYRDEESSPPEPHGAGEGILPT